MMLTTNDPLPGLTFGIVSPIVQGVPTIYIGETMTLVLSLISGPDDIALTAGTSKLQIFMPHLYTIPEVAQMTLDFYGNQDWVPSQAGLSLTLTYRGAGTWPADTELRFAISNAATSADATANTLPITINPQSFSGTNIPATMPAQVALINPPIATNPELSGVLVPSLDHQGQVFVSGLAPSDAQSIDIVQNTLVLNLQNTQVGASIYQGESAWKGSPTVTAAFVPGRTAGALGTTDPPTGTPPKAPIGSLWGISAQAGETEGNAWTVTNPDPNDEAASPSWSMSPTGTNLDIIGFGPNASVEFEFSPIVTVTNPGHTQMILTFSGFPFNDTVYYNDAVFLLDIPKGVPTQRGVQSFYPTNNQVLYDLTPSQPSVTVPLTWSVLYASTVRLISSYPGMAPYTPGKPYPLSPTAQTDTYALTIPPTVNSMPLFLTLQAFDVNGGYLNSMQLTLYVTSNVFVDTRDGTMYPTILVGTTIWMAADMAYQTNDSNSFPNGIGGPGLLYTATYAQANPPVGWRLPSLADWQNLATAAGQNGADAYQTLICGGNSSNGFDATLGGYYLPGSGSSDAYADGYYWTTTASQDNQVYAQFIQSAGVVNLNGSLSFPAAYGCAVRYVKDI